MMTATEIAEHLILHCRTLEAFESYMFGSTLKGIGHDIDLLIVGPSNELLSILKKELLLAGSKLPLDILYMTPSEAMETNFVNRTGCIRLSVVASINSNYGKM